MPRIQSENGIDRFSRNDWRRFAFEVEGEYSSSINGVLTEERKQ
jgi:hypothetical protein